MGPLPFFKTVFTSAFDPSPLIVRGGYYSSSKFVGYTQPMDLKYFKALAAASGTSFSTMVLTALTNALKKVSFRYQK